MFTGAGNGTERFRLYTQTNNNVFFQTTTANAIYGIRTGNSFTNNLRMLVRGQISGADTTGRMALGNSLPENFVPRERLHLHHINASNVGMRFTNTATAADTNDGTNLGITNTGDFLLKQYENDDISLLNPTSTSGDTLVERFRIAPNGQVFVGRRGDWNAAVQDNVIDGPPVSGFSNPLTPDRTSLLNVRGPIFSAYPVDAANPQATILYGYSDPAAHSSGSLSDGFRMKVNRDFFGNSLDALVFEKIDGNNSFVDGGIAFTATINDTLERPTFYIRGNGRTYVGRNIFSETLLQNRFVIDSDTNDATPSGLRFINLTSNSPTVSNPNPDGSVLSVDANGNVIYVPGGAQGPAGTAKAHNGTSRSTIDTTFIALGQDLGQAGNPAELLSHREIPMRNHQINFDTGYVNINSLANERMLAGLNVRPANGTSSANALNPDPGNTTTGNRALNVFNTNASPIGIDVFSMSTSGNCHGTTSYASSTAPLTAIGVQGYATRNNVSGFLGTRVIGVEGISNNANGDSYGIFGTSMGKTNSSFGVFGQVLDSASNAYGIHGDARAIALNNYGVYGTALSSSTNNYSIYGAAAAGGTNNYAGYFVGMVNVQGSLTVNNTPVLTSDQMFKTNVGNIENALDLIGQLQPRTYLYDTVSYPEFGFESDLQIGLIAQEVEQVLPTLVNERKRPAQYDPQGNEIQAELTFKGLEYEELIPLLIAGVKEQQTQIDSQQTEIESKDSLITNLTSQVNDLNSRLSQLENCLSALLPALCEANQMAVQQTPQEIQRELVSKIQVKLSDKNTIVLAQNVPNPFAESTVIAYSIPVTVKQAQIHFYDAQGKLIHSVDLTERGTGELTVFADDLSSGQYSYNLVADGKIVASKKMVKL